MFCGLRFHEACYGRACLGDFRFGNFPALFDGFFDTVVEMIVDEQHTGGRHASIVGFPAGHGIGAHPYADPCGRTESADRVRWG